MTLASPYSYESQAAEACEPSSAAIPPQTPCSSRNVPEAGAQPLAEHNACLRESKHAATARSRKQEKALIESFIQSSNAGTMP